MQLHELQTSLWEVILQLRQAERITNKEATSICLVRFTWTKEQVQDKLKELTGRLSN